MGNMRARALALLLAASALAAAAAGAANYLNAEHPLMMAIDPERGYRASLVYKRTFPFDRYDVYLVVRDASGSLLDRRPLLRYVESPQKASENVGDLRFDGSHIVFKKTGVLHHYSIATP
jgi:hypothetical protein